MKVVIVAPNFFDYGKQIQDEFEKQDHTVTLIDDRPSNLNILKIIVRLNLAFLIKSFIKKHQFKITQDIIKIKPDLLLLITPELFTPEMVKKIKNNNKSCKVVLYSWDSIKNKPKLKNLLPSVDKAFSFDINDCDENKEVSHHPLFFNSSEIHEQEYEIPRVIKCSFVGTYHSDRSVFLRRDFLENKEYFFYLYIQGPIIRYIRVLALFPNFTKMKLLWNHSQTKKIPRREMIKILKSSCAVLDINHPSQTGLTMRTFEALGNGCKLITTNKHIKQYDFYGPEIISVIDLNNPVIDNDFIYKPITPSAALDFQNKFAKYSLENWIQKIIEI